MLSYSECRSAVDDLAWIQKAEGSTPSTPTMLGGCKMYYRKEEDNRRHKKITYIFEDRWFGGPWWYDDKRKCYIYTKGGNCNKNIRFYKKHASKITRKSDCFGKNNSYRKYYPISWHIW